MQDSCDFLTQILSNCEIQRVMQEKSDGLKEDMFKRNPLFTKNVFCDACLQEWSHVFSKGAC